MPRILNNCQYCIVAFLLFLAIIFQLLGDKYQGYSSRAESVAKCLPGEAYTRGWNTQVLPIANTIEERRAVKELLNYDDAVYVVYSKGGETVSVYIAYWQPGKMSYRLIAGHAPDICWINSGWVCTHSEICNNISD